MKFNLFPLFCCMVSLPAIAQNTRSVKGSVADTAANGGLQDAVVSVLNAKDSTLIKFTRTASDGSFFIGQLKNGQYLLMVSYPGYADYVEDFTTDSLKSERDFRQIIMTLKSKLLENIIVTGSRAAIRIKGDTTEYNASRFVIKPNDRVEDLLRQFPGIQIDKDGKITAQGKEVNKVLVDGEEFFGDDPTLVTRNIRSDMVDKVQLYDKKSDQAALSGIDDGIRNKTINIKLKENKKHGYFGKAEAGIGTNKFYQEQLMFNAFKGKRKFAAYGLLSNNGKTGLAYDDVRKFDIRSSMDMDDSQESDDLDAFDGKYNGSGIPSSASGGIHYDNKWDEDKKGVGLNYNTGNVKVTGVNNTMTQNNLPSGIINTNADQSFNKSLFRQKLDLLYTTVIDSVSSLKVTVAGMTINSESDVQNATASYRGNDTLLNRNENGQTINGKQNTINANAFYSRKFKKPGRSITVSVTEIADQNDLNGYLKSSIDFYNGKGSLDSTQLIDQYKVSKTKRSAFSTDINYSEKFSKTFSVWFSYKLQVSNSSADRRSFNASAPSKYNTLDSVFSNNYEFNQLSNQLGAVFNYKKKNTSISFGTKAAAVTFKQFNLFTSNKYQRDFINWTPQLSYKYSPSEQNTLKLSYSGNTIQPLLSQIQPVRQNTDPLNIYTGNPSLRPSFNNKFEIKFQSFKVLSQQFISFNGSYSIRSNDIASSVFTDTTGKTISQSINITDRRPSDFDVSLVTYNTLKKLGINITTASSVNGNTYYNYVNGILNKTRSYSFSEQISLDKTAVKYNFRLSFGPTYNFSQASLQKEINNNGVGFVSGFYGKIILPGGVECSSDVSYTYTAKTRSFDKAFSRIIINAKVSKALVKDGSLKVQLSGNDLLNQNSGFNRRATGNLIIQNTNTTVQRFFLFSLIYDFNKMGK